MNLNLISKDRMIPKLDINLLNNYLDWNVDFDGEISDQRFGAYANEKIPYWYPNLGIKPILTKKPKN